MPRTPSRTLANPTERLQIQPDLFTAEPTAKQEDLVRAERELLQVADYIYAHTSLKPMSKALFALSRCLIVAAKEEHSEHWTPESLTQAYRRVCTSFGGPPPIDDYDFSSLAVECEQHLSTIMQAVQTVCRLTVGSDRGGLAFNTLLRGKFEGGEGLGTYLTPEEVVGPMVDMLLATVEPDALDALADERAWVYGDPCGGTGRFVYAMARQLARRGLAKQNTSERARLFDQSSLAVGLARINFALDDLYPPFQAVSDSLTSPDVGALRNRFSLIATNPPFGSNKYKWAPSLSVELPAHVLAALQMQGPGDKADPAEIFFYRCLDLLAPGGALAIVLPDGLLQSARFRSGLGSYEHATDYSLHVAALVSLPVATFALGGTVAKTSFAIVRKEHRGAASRQMYVATASHVGFRKRGNCREPDPKGNDLERVASEYASGDVGFGRFAAPWRGHDRIGLNGHCATTMPAALSLGDYAQTVRDYGVPISDGASGVHVSILDVDETGLIDVITASANRTQTPPLKCLPGDILVSCLNPKIWRVTIVPDIDVGPWSCSPEFLVLRPKPSVDRWLLAISLHQAIIQEQIQAMAGGTSSSRQRVPKQGVLAIQCPLASVDPAVIAEHRDRRQSFYRERLREAAAYARLHNGGSRFALDGVGDDPA